MPSLLRCSVCRMSDSASPRSEFSSAGSELLGMTISMGVSAVAMGCTIMSLGIWAGRVGTTVRRLALGGEVTAASARTAAI